MLSNMKFGSRIILALVLPILGLVFFSGYLVLEKRQVSQEMEILRKMASLAPTVSAAMHELQKERGASAVFIGSKGKSFKEELPQQHKETDAHMAELEAALNAIDKNVLSPSLLENMEAARAELGELAAKRERILKRTQNIMQVNGYYVSVISNLLNIVEGMAALSQDAAVSRAIAAYTTFLQAKEHAGQELAVGSAGFGASKFQPILHRRFIELITEQGILLDAFAVYAPPAQKEALDALLSGAEAGEVDRMRTIAVNSQYANIDGQLVNTTEGIRAPDWFGVVSKKIAAMKEIEDALASGLIAQAESVQSEASTTFFIFLAATIAALIVTGGLAYAIVTGITGPILGLTNIMERLAHGDTTIAITGTERGDEIGEMSQAVQVFKENMIRNQQLAAEQQQENEAKERKRLAMEKLAGEFEKNVSSALSEVTNASSDMRQTAQNMAATAEETSRQSTAVAAAAEQASTNVQTVASAAEELSSSISEISRQVSQSTKIAGSAVTEVSGANDKVQGLAEAARKIGEVVALITDIADQTNLLALNATIEAARAGEAGKGFAVVASEVKNLANQTAKATEDISAQIAGIQDATNEAVAAIESIGGTINQINEITSAIAAAVEEQGAATQEIARNVEQAAAGTTDVTSNITGVNQAANDTGHAAEQVLASVNGLTRQSDQLGHQVEDFLKGLKAI